MSLLAIDLGNCNIVGAVPRGKGVDVVVSDSSSKVIPSVVSYTSERRFFADQASAQRISNRLQCYTHLPLMVGESIDSAAVQRARFAGAYFDIRDFNGRAVSHISFGGEDLSLEFDQIAAALLAQLKKYAESMDKVMPYDFIIAVPAQWRVQKKMKLLAAARATGLNCLGVISQQAAVAANYYMRRVAEFQKLPENNYGVKIGFLSTGEIESWAAVVQMNKQGINVINFASDPELGSIDFDKVLAELILEKAVQKCKQITRDELLSKKSYIKIMRAANQCKKVLSLNSNAPATLECVGDSQIDIYVLINQTEFAERCQALHLVERVDKLIRSALGYTPASELEAFEAVGGASRVKSVQELLNTTFGDRISRRLNADEAVAVGACWIGAMRSSKHHIPFDIKIVDYIVNLYEKLILQVYAADGTPVFETPFDMFRCGEIFPKSKKITLRFEPGSYVAKLTDGENVIEESKFVVAEKNFTYFDSNKEFAAANGVKFEERSVQLKLKVIADENGFFRISELQRNDYDLVFDDVKKQVPNEKYDEENAAFEAEKAKIEADFAEKTRCFDELSTVYDQKMKEYEAAKKQAEKPADVPAPEMYKPVKPVKQAYPNVPKKERDVTEKVPRIANYSRDVAAENVFSVYNQTEKAKSLMEFEQKCKQIDRAALRYDSAINRLDSLIYQTREAFDYGNLHEFITDDEKTQIHAWLEEAGVYRNQIQGRSQTEEIETRSTELEAKLQPFYTRKASHQHAEERIFMLNSDVGSIEARFYEPENAMAVQNVKVAYQALREAFDYLNKKSQVPDNFFDTFTQTMNQAEQDMRKVQKEIEDAKKQAAEEAKKAAEAAAKQPDATPSENEQKK